jgi:signal transduction histidine kinase
VAIALSVLGARVPLARLALLMVAVVAAAARDRRLAFLAVWAIAGAGLFLLTPERNASYYRHLAVPTAILSAAAFASMVDALSRARAIPAALRRSVTLPRAAVAAVVLSAAILLAARAAPVPFLSAKLEDIEYVKDLSFTFRDVITQAAAEAAAGDTLLMFRGPTREEESHELYGRGYLDRLQPSKFAYYEWYFRLLGRDDLRVAAIEDVAGEAGPARGRRVLAVNAWETERVIADLGLRPAREFLRGRARAALFGP